MYCLTLLALCDSAFTKPHDHHEGPGEHEGRENHVEIRSALGSDCPFIVALVLLTIYLWLKFSQLAQIFGLRRVRFAHHLSETVRRAGPTKLFW